MTRVKVCCIASVEEAKIAVSMGVNTIGLVGPMPTGPGVIDLEVASRIASSTPPGVSSFLLTSGRDAGKIADDVLDVGANTVQLVRQLEADTHRELRTRLPKSVQLVQVVHVGGQPSLEYARGVAANVDGLLLDSGRPEAQILGGTGETHDWEVSRRIVESVDIPVWLAGGLNSTNLGSAIASVGPFGVDVCSGVRRDGKLDAEELAAFFGALRDHSVEGRR